MTDILPTSGQDFDKYKKRGAYHWRVLNTPWRRIGGYPARLMARYHLILQQISRKPQRVLDIGCGDGALTHIIAQKGHLVIGLDPELEGVGLATTLTQEHAYEQAPSFMVGSAYTIPLNDRSVDIVVMGDVIEHLQYPQLALNEAHRVLKQGGRVIISTPQRLPGKALEAYHFQEFTATELAELLSEPFATVDVICSELLAWYQLYHRRILGRRIFGFTMNASSALGLNPFLGQSRERSLRYCQLTAIAIK